MGVLGAQGVEGIHPNYISTCFVPRFLSVGTAGNSEEHYITTFLLHVAFVRSPSQETLYGVSPQPAVLFSVGTTGHQAPGEPWLVPTAEAMLSAKVILFRFP